MTPATGPGHPARDGDIAEGFVAIGRILTAWKLGGEVKVEPLAPDAQLAAGRTVTIRGERYRIERAQRRMRFLHLKLAGVETPEAARELRGAYLEAEEAELAPLEPDSYYRFQLIGLAVRTVDGRDLGRIAEVVSTAGNDIYVVRGPLGEVLIPATDEVVREVDVGNGGMTIEPIPGLLPE